MNFHQPVHNDGTHAWVDVRLRCHVRRTRRKLHLHETRHVLAQQGVRSSKTHKYFCSHAMVMNVCCVFCRNLGHRAYRTVHHYQFVSVKQFPLLLARVSISITTAFTAHAPYFRWCMGASRFTLLILAATLLHWHCCRYCTARLHVVRFLSGMRMH